ncbi:HelD family protein [Actinoplanes derwentensis]|uniref:DNA helicase IV n=1 Tax=Actinoplanes derwentensis TaxID=113562 RepID=A0A1H1VDE1_9ACTN|nr:ATP-binding domain-containing protein [Actinoplanes derwentensis]GID83748.1 DNA helicase [Actinoplanes derwentensis]SDS82209.1 DNA helicase IV [Actinoplanes derwentensis]
MLSLELLYLQRVRDALAWMLDHARMRVTTGEQIAGDRYTAETLGRMLKSHAKELASEPDGPPYFGRMDYDDHRYYIGRRRITDATGAALVIDWRAPVSARFYQAGARNPLGVTARRRYGWTMTVPAQLTGFEDEDLLREYAEPSRLLTEEIERPRVGPMRDIVATIQPDQDELVRTALNRSLCIQGGPGTGKTAVGLHRAAYLLYTHREQLKRTGVLIVGPNPAFLRHIAAVLPALGEIDIRQRTLSDLLGTPQLADDPAADTVKHDPRMAAVLAAAIRATISAPIGDLVVPDGSVRLRVPEADLARLAGRIRAENLPHELGRERLRARITGLLARQIESRGESTGYAWTQRISRCKPVKAVLDQVWPKVRPDDLLATLLSDPATLARAADGILTAAEQATIRRPRRSRRWSAADLVLLDEIAGLIDHPESFGHIVVDEAQDLSPMECRVIARRNRHGSLTVLGDLAQGTSGWAAADWPAQMAHLGRPDAPITALTRGFRVPAVVLNYANRLLPALGVSVPATTSVRADGSLTVDEIPDVATAVRAALTYEGSIAVIATESRLATINPDIIDVRVTLLPAHLAKGLEFDHVIVVNPQEIIDAEPRGQNRLYVALTRAVSRLDVLSVL